MTTSFTNTFGASAISPADVAYAAYTFSADLVLYWPAFSAGQTDVAARFMNLTASVGSLDVSLPDATLTSTGQDVVIFNAGSNTFNVVDYDGGAIATIASGQTYYIILNDNATQAGGWQTVQFGVGTGSASAAALAGAGLLAIANTLNVNTLATAVSGSYSITSAQRGILQVWTGGVGTITLPSAASVGNGFFFPFANNGSGSVTISAGDDIDGATTSVYSQTQSGFIISTGTTWYSVGKGTQTNFAVTLLNLNVAGSADITETSAQAQNVIQQFTGVLTGNINVIVPNTVQLYYIFNDTTGAYTLTVKTAAGTGITVDQGSHTILYCDGTNVVNAFTSTFGGGISLSPGSAGSPNLNFIGSTNTGLYSPATGQIAVTAAGKEVLNFIADASAVNWLEVGATATGVAPTITAKGGDTNIGITLAGKGTGGVGIAKALITGGAIDGVIIGASSAAAITGTTITGSSLIGPLTGNVTGNLTGNVTGNVTGNASTATALQNARTIGGVSFDGTANITVATATGGFTVSGGNLALGANNLTLTGSVGATGARSTKGWFTDLEISNAPTIGGVSATGSGGLVRATSPSLVTPVLGVASATSLTFGGSAMSTFAEGTFVPTVIGTSTAGTASYSNQVGRYTRINNRVFITLVLTWTGGTGTGNLKITGLPFTVQYTAGIAGYFDGLVAGAGNVLLSYVESSSANIDFVAFSQTTGSSASLAYDGTGDFRSSFVYETV